MYNKTQIKFGEHKSISTEFKKGNIPHNKGKKMQPVTKKTIQRIKSTINKHHIDLNTKNNIIENCLFLMPNDHRRLHARAYDYLVELNLIDNYIDWFKEKYNPKEFMLDEYLAKLTKTRKYFETKLMKQNIFDSKRKPVKIQNLKNKKDYLIFLSAKEASIYLKLHPNTISTAISLKHNTIIDGEKYKPSYITKEEYLKLTLETNKG